MWQGVLPITDSVKRNYLLIYQNHTDPQATVSLLRPAFNSNRSIWGFKIILTFLEMLLYNNNRDREENMSSVIPLSSIYIGFEIIYKARGRWKDFEILECYDWIRSWTSKIKRLGVVSRFNFVGYKTVKDVLRRQRRRRKRGDMWVLGLLPWFTWATYLNKHKQLIRLGEIKPK